MYKKNGMSYQTVSYLIVLFRAATYFMYQMTLLRITFKKKKSNLFLAVSIRIKERIEIQHFLIFLSKLVSK